MRIFLFVNNTVGLEIARFIASQSEATLVGAALHPIEKAACREEIIQALPTGTPIFDGTTLADPEVIDRIKTLAPDIGISAYFGHILRRPLLSLFPLGAVNLHPSLLPKCRGAHPNVWPILENSETGVTLHQIDEGVDTGDILVQRRVKIHSTDTGGSLYRRLAEESIALFQEAWPKLIKGELIGEAQDHSRATVHRITDLQTTDEIHLDSATTGRELINRLRARTFPPHSGCWFRDGHGRKIMIRVELEASAE